MKKALNCIFRDAGWKLLSLAVAVVIWSVVSAESESATTITSAAIEYKHMPDYLEIGSDPLTSVKLELRGSSSALRALSAPVVSLDLTGVAAGEHAYPLGDNNVKLGTGAHLVRAIPSVLRLKLERRITASVPVTARLAGEPAAGFAVTHVTVEPPVLMVVGPASRVERLHQAFTDPVDISGIQSDKTLRVDAVADDSFVRFQTEPKVTITVTVRKR